MRTSDAEPASATGAREIDVPQFVDPRGCLVAFEQARPLRFKPAGTFIIAAGRILLRPLPAMPRMTSANIAPRGSVAG